MSIKLVVFDLDGVLIDSRDLHYEVLNSAITDIAGAPYAITEKEHLYKYDGLSTKQKLKRLTADKGLDSKHYDAIWNLKQSRTFEALRSIVVKDDRLIDIFKYLKEDLGIKVAIASNSIKETIDIVVDGYGIRQYVDLVLSNEDVWLPKPHPQMYLKAMTVLGSSPTETMVIEDSYIGRTAAISSGAHLCPVKNSKELSRDLVSTYLDNANACGSTNKLRWRDHSMNVLIPMAGEGSRFVEAGYSVPKPFIPVNGVPMVELAVKNLNIDAHFIFLIRESHDKEHGMSAKLKATFPGCSVVLVEHLTEGAACTTLLAKHLIDNNCPLLIANSDQYLDWDACEFYHSVNTPVDGAVLTFDVPDKSDTRWSFVQTDDDNTIVKIEEKVHISDKASVGVYYFAKGSDYVRWAESMIAKDLRYGKAFNGRGEFYVAPVYNEGVLEGASFKIYDVENMWGLGTPSDLNNFLENHK